MKSIEEIEDLARKIESSVGKTNLIEAIEQAKSSGFEKDDLLEACHKISEHTQDRLASLGYPVRDLPSNWESSID